jgi:serralysin
MAYRTFQGQFLDDSLDADIFPGAPMALDVDAIRYLYGARAVAPGDDIYRFGENERLFTTIVDDGGIDTIDWSNRSDAAVMDLRQGNWSQLGQPYSWPESRLDWGGTFSGTTRTAAGTIIERAIGGSGDDRIIGNGTDNTLSGLAGADELRGGGGDDQLSGGAGADSLFGEGGNDQLNGGDAGDMLDGGGDIDFLFGGNGADRMGGGAGSDELHGGDGSDILSGSAGDDTVGGGAADDALSGGAGSDRMIGGTGRDRFVLDPEANSSDRITDFVPGIDTIVLRDGYTTQSFLAAAKGTVNGTLFELANGHDVLVAGAQGANASWFGS